MTSSRKWAYKSILLQCKQGNDIEKGNTTTYKTIVYTDVYEMLTRFTITTVELFIDAEYSFDMKVKYRKRMKGGWITQINL